MGRRVADETRWESNRTRYCTSHQLPLVLCPIPTTRHVRDQTVEADYAGPSHLSQASRSHERTHFHPAHRDLFASKQELSDVVSREHPGAGQQRSVMVVGICAGLEKRVLWLQFGHLRHQTHRGCEPHSPRTRQNSIPIVFANSRRASGLPAVYDPLPL